ncbi:serine hydrolase domain-containing protein [Bacteroidota bacterium]
MKKLYLLVYLFLALFIYSCENGPEDPTTYSWKSSRPEAQDMDSDILDSALLEAELTGFIDGLLVIRNGKIVAEGYFNGFDAIIPHTVMSVSKSFLSAITGIAYEQGYIESLDEKVLAYFPEYIFPGMDTRKNDISIRHLLTMRMGIKGEADDDYGVYQGLYSSENWMKETLESELIDAPGEKMHYNTFQTHLLSGIITKATQKSTFDFCQQELLDPMNIDVDAWEQDPQGYFFGGNTMHFTPREMAVLGYLYLNNGRIDDKQIIPESWVELTTSASSDFKHPNEWGAWKNYNYAYLWWLGQINDYDLFMAYGYGGQFVVVFPELNLIVVTTAKNEVAPETTNIQEWAIFDIISKYILPSIEE